MKYDSTLNTLEHMGIVKEYMNECVRNLIIRLETHDDSKLKNPEKPFFDKYKPVLDRFAYPSDEYTDALKKLKVGLKHHYENNSHHPEHYGQSSQLTDQYLDSIKLHQNMVTNLNSHLGMYGAAFKVVPAPYEYEGGVNEMSLFDILEMLMDHKAASEKTLNGSIEKSLDYGRERFGYSDQLYKILQNTAREMGWM